MKSRKMEQLSTRWLHPYCSAAGVYNDYGLSKLARRQAQNEAQRAERDRMVNLRISLSPKVTEAQQDQIWNEIL